MSSQAEEYIQYSQDSLTSIYIHDYTGRQGDRSKSMKRTSEPLPDVKFDGASTTRLDYQSWPRANTQSCKPANKDNENKGKFDATTNYNVSFAGQPGEVRQPFKPNSSVVKGVPFDASSTSKNDFKPYGKVDRVHPIRPSATVVENVPFQATSSHATDFTSHPNATRRSFKPNSTANTLNEDRSFQTETNSQHNGTLGPAARSTKPNNSLNSVPESRDFQSEAKGNFDNKGFSRTAPFLPARTVLPDQKLDATTTNRTDFGKPVNGQAAKSCKPNVSRTDVPDDRNWQSENRGCFVPHKTGPRHVYRNNDQYNPGEDTRDWTTEMKSTMRPLGPGERCPVVKPANQTGMLNNIPFTATSTSGHDFQAHPGAKTRKSFKPTQSAAIVDDNRDYSTEYKQYTGTLGAPTRSAKPVSVLDNMNDDRDWLTIARDSYVNKPYSQTAPFKPQSTVLPNQPLDGTTTNRTDFGKPVNGQAAKSCKPNVSRTDVPDDRNWQSENRGCFVPHKTGPRHVYRNNDQYNPGDDNRDWTTEMKSTMKPHGQGERAAIIKPSQTVMDNVPFNSTSTHSQDFRNYGNATRRSFRPNQSSNALGEDRDFGTEHRGNFVEYGGPVYAEHLIPLDTKPSGSFRYLR